MQQVGIVIIAVIKRTNKEVLNINLELSFLKTPKTNKNIIDKEIKISGKTKFKLFILLIYKIIIVHIY